MKFFTIVPQKTQYVLERLGKFHKILQPGLHFIFPFLDHISFKHCLKEKAIKVPRQSAVTQDNVTITVSGVIFYKILDAYKASYEIDQSEMNVANLCQTITRAQIGQLGLDKLFQEREKINKNVNKRVNQITGDWGIQTLRYEILNIDPPKEIKKAMTYEAEAERNKRRDINLSEGKKQSQIKKAEGKSYQRISRAEGAAKRIQLLNEAQSDSLKMISKAIKCSHGQQAVDYMLHTNYLKGLRLILDQAYVSVIPHEKGKGKQGKNDIMALAALLAMGGGSQHSDYYGDQNTNYNQGRGKNNDKVGDFHKKYDFYSDPVMYDDPLQSDDPY